MNNELIYLVEDDEFVAKAWQRILKRAGYDNVMHYASTAVASTALDSLVPKLIISDNDCPFPNAGAELCKYVKNEFNNVGFIGMSGVYGVRASFLDAKADAFLEKPFHSGELLTLVSELLVKYS